MKSITLPRAVFVTLLLFLAALQIFVPHSQQKIIKSPAEIYEEADYLAHINVVLEHVTYGRGDGHLSGVLIQHKNKYLILTAGHIDLQNPKISTKEINFSLKGLPGTYFANLYAVDHTIDCAVLKITDIMKGYKFSFSGRLPQFGSSTDLKVGQPVCSLGSPLETKFTLGVGTIKNLNDKFYWHTVILHNADVAPGSSGGPLLNNYGEIIGMNLGLNLQYHNFCYAIYIEEVLKWLDTID